MAINIIPKLNTCKRGNERKIPKLHFSGGTWSIDAVCEA